jgi:hypothetical protein
MPGLDWIVPAAYLQEGPVCAFPLAVPLNFTSCCAAGQTVQQSGVCYQFCVVNQTDAYGIDSFSQCASWVAEGQNQTLGISGCQHKSSGTIQANRWKGSMILVGVAMFLFVI